MNWKQSHVPYLGAQEPIVWMNWISWNSHICLIQLILRLRPKKLVFANLPLCQGCLGQHIKRVIVIGKWDHIAEPDIPSSFNGHGWTNPWAIIVWVGCSTKKAGWCCWRSWIRWQFLWWMLICFLSGIIIQINHVDESYHCTD